MIAQNPGLCWDKTTGLAQQSEANQEPLPKGILVPDSQTNSDKVAVVYQRGTPPPQITVQEISGTVTSVHANGIPVAIVARAKGPDLTPEDILLVERMI